MPAPSPSLIEQACHTLSSRLLYPPMAQVRPTLTIAACTPICISGTTLTVVAWNRARAELTVAHAGDSVALLVEGTAAAGQATPLLSNSSRHVLVARCVSTTANLRLTYPDPHSHPVTLSYSP